MTDSPLVREVVEAARRYCGEYAGYCDAFVAQRRFEALRTAVEALDAAPEPAGAFTAEQERRVCELIMQNTKIEDVLLASIEARLSALERAAKEPHKHETGPHRGDGSPMPTSQDVLPGTRPTAIACGSVGAAGNQDRREAELAPKPRAIGRGAAKLEAEGGSVSCPPPSTPQAEPGDFEERASRILSGRVLAVYWKDVHRDVCALARAAREAALRSCFDLVDRSAEELKDAIRAINTKPQKDGQKEERDV